MINTNTLGYNSHIRGHLTMFIVACGKFLLLITDLPMEKRSRHFCMHTCLCHWTFSSFVYILPVKPGARTKQVHPTTTSALRIENAILQFLHIEYGGGSSVDAHLRLIGTFSTIHRFTIYVQRTAMSAALCYNTDFVVDPMHFLTTSVQSY